DQTWLEAWFQSVIARTAGFATYPLANFSHSAILIFTILMFIGASPNSTGGGVKTTTVFVAAVKAFSSSAEHDEDSVFYRRIPDLVFSKAFVVLFFGMFVVLCGSFLVMIGNPQADMDQVLVEVTSAFATVGSSMGLTPDLSFFSKAVIMICMFIGRLGPVTIANLLVTGSEKAARYTEENVLIG
ncbi:potassium transporter TrkG, partial [Ileibacterium valens]